MATDIFCVDTHRSLDSEVVTEDIKEGEPVSRIEGGGIRLFDTANDDEVNFLVVHERDGDHNPRYDNRYQSYEDLYTYQPEANKDGGEAADTFDDRAPILPLVNNDVVRSYLIEDESQPEPSIEENAEVGYVDFGNGPRLVEEGYEDSGGTTYGNAGPGDYVPLGYVDRLPSRTDHVGDYGELIPVRVDTKLTVN
jgi:hypothetical protein